MRALLKIAKRTVIAVASLLIIALTISSCSTLHALTVGYADHFSTCFCYKSQWSNWEKHYFPTSSYSRQYDDFRISSSTASNGDIIGLSLSDSGGNVYYSFRINNYTPGQKQFTGTVEYYVNDNYPTAEALAKANHFVRPNYRTDQTPSVKRTARATIKIVNDEKKPQVFNIWYDNIGVGFSVRNVYWHD